jgi:hypothetical protein
VHGNCVALMIERYTIKFGPAVSQKELEKALDDSTIHGEIEISNKAHMMKARIEVIGDFEDLKKLSEVLKELSKK